VSVDPQFGIHRLVKVIKGRSSRLRRQEFPAIKRKLPTLWTNSYCVGTTGGAPLRNLKQYIEQQKHVEAREVNNGQQADKNVSVPALSDA
jgi:REP-associated tyrosine transposase